MRHHINQHLISPLMWVVILTVIALFLMVLVLLTPLGPRVAAQLVSLSVPNMSIQGVSGSFMSQVHVERFIWDDGDSIEISDIDVSLERFDIGNRGLSAHALQVGQLDINLLTTPSDPDKEVDIPDFGLPVTILSEVVGLKSLRINRLVNLPSQGLKDLLASKKQVTETLFQIEDLQLEKLEIRDHKLHFARLKGNPIVLDAPLKINVTDGNLNMDKPHDLHTRGTLSFRHVDLGEASGDIDLKGTLTHYEFDTRLALDQSRAGPHTLKLSGKGDYKQVQFDTLHLTGESGNLEGRAEARWDPDISWSVSGDVRAIDTTRWLSDWPLRADAKIAYRGSYREPESDAPAAKSKSVDQEVQKILHNDLELTAFKGKLDSTKGQLPGTLAVFANGHIGTRADKVFTKGLDLKLGGNKLKLTGRASEPFDLDVIVDASSLSQLVAGLSGELKGKARLSGTYRKPLGQISLAATGLKYQDFTQGKERLFLEGDVGLAGDVLNLRNMSLKTAANRVEASGQLSEPMSLNWKIDANQLVQISPDLRGSITGEGRISGPYRSALIKGSINTSGLRFKQTEIGKLPIRAVAEVEIKEGVPLIRTLEASSGKNRIQISGRASSPYDLKWDIEGSNLGELLTGLGGRLSAKGSLQGTIEQPVFNATADARNVKFNDFSLDSADLRATTTNGQYQISGNLKKMASKKQKIGSAQLELNGVIENHRLNLDFTHNDASVVLKAQGKWQDEQWQGSLQQLEIQDKQAGKWSLQSAVSIKASEKSLDVSRFCLRNADAMACASVNRSQTAGLVAEGKLQKTPLSLFTPVLPEGVKLDGTAEGSFDLRSIDGRPRGSLKLKLPDSSLTFKNEEGDEQMLSYQDATVEATINDRIIVATANMKVLNRGQVTSKATITLSPADGRHTIDGSVQLDVPNIYWAQDFIPRSRGLRGVVTSKLSITGLLEKPSIVGKASLTEGYLRLPEAGTELTDITLNITADRPGMAVIKGTMMMGKGALNINGTMDTSNIAKWKANVTIKGNNILFMNTNEIRARMSPDIAIEATPEIFAITGKVTIPQADINLKEIPETSIDESDDVIVVGEKKKGEQVTAVKIRPDVTIELGDNIKLKAFGLRARLSGSMRITHRRNEILAQGALNVTDGKYQAYGQNLDIKQGRLIFNGSPKIIGMDIRATRQIDQQLVGVHLGGTLLSPKSTIFSEPLLPESEALSLLLTGHNLDSASGQESALLMSAVRGLGVSGGDSLLHSIGSSLGLDDVNIVAKEDFRQSELALGKRLGSRLYVRYLVGLFDQTQKIAVDYKINKLLSLQAETGLNTYGLDFIYKFERD